jgi:putative transposase
VLTGRPDHLKTFDYLGPYRYFLTFCTFERRTHFISLEPVNLVLLQIQRAATEHQFALVAYCFMPDHLHLLVEALAENSDARRFIEAAKQYSGFYFKQKFKHPLWQRYGFERTLRDEEATLGVVRYIVENPLRAGLVEKVEAYPFAGSSMYSLGEVLQAVAILPNRAG